MSRRGFVSVLYARIAQERDASREPTPEGDVWTFDADGRPLTQQLHIAFFAPSHALVDALATKQPDEALLGPTCLRGPNLHNRALKSPLQVGVTTSFFIRNLPNT